MAKFRVILEYDDHGNGYESIDVLSRHIEMMVNAGAWLEPATVKHVVPLDPVDDTVVRKVVEAVHKEAASRGIPVKVETYIWDTHLDATESSYTVVRVHTELEEQAALDLWEVLSSTATKGLTGEDRYRINIDTTWKH